ncbi:MAG TPA: DUF885 domain-containing protein, partial [bacterium]|nr:DUF885 domain-containing protein [bacterium]
MRLLVGLSLLLALPQITGQGTGQIAFSPAVAARFVDSLATDYYQTKFAMYPAYATSKGVDTWDSTLATYGPRKVRSFLIATKRKVLDLNSISEDSLSIQAWVDMKALKADMETQVFMLEELQLYRRSPLLYTDECTNGLYYLMIRHDNFRENPNFIARLEAVPRVLNVGRANLTKPIKLHCEVASAGITAFLPFLDSLADSSNPAEAGLAKAAGNARQAFLKFRAYLDSTSATADPDFALGRDNFGTLLKTEHLVDEPPEDLVAYAQRVLKDAEKERDAQKNRPEAVKRDTTGARTLTKADILADFDAETDSAIAFLERRAIVTVPRNTVVKPVETPDFIRVLVPGYAYEPPGPFDKNQVGLLYVPLPKVLDLAAQIDYKSRIDRRSYRGIVVHELYPGHHLQMTRANSAGTYIRRLADDNFTIEGWALYCEEMMAAQGYFGTDGSRRALDGIIFRAARAVVDVKLQTGEFSLNQAVDFMAKETGRDRGFIEQEVRRYAVEPTQAMSYLIGKRDIVALRDECKRIKG